MRKAMFLGFGLDIVVTLSFSQSGNRIPDVKEIAGFVVQPDRSITPSFDGTFHDLNRHCWRGLFIQLRDGTEVEDPVEGDEIVVMSVLGSAHTIRICGSCGEDDIVVFNQEVCIVE